MSNNNLIVTEVLPKLFLTLLISFIASIVGVLFVPPIVALLIGISALVILIVYLFRRGFRRGEITEYGVKMSMSFVYFMVTLLGIAISASIKFYLSSIGAAWVAAAFGITVVLVGVLFLYAYNSKRDFSFLGGILFFALLALILVSIVAIFIKSALLHLILAWVGIMIFSGYMLYDVSRMKKSSFTKEDVPGAVFDLYLNFINLFLDILRVIWYFVSDLNIGD